MIFIHHMLKYTHCSLHITIIFFCQVEKQSDAKSGGGEGDNCGSIDDEGSGLERGGNRSSIAERRRLYENRSMSVQEPVNPSPTPLRRRDSLKVRFVA